MSDYVEKRSAHALAVDRAINARVKHSQFNTQYASDPSSSDVAGYDDRYEPKPKEPKKPTPGDGGKTKPVSTEKDGTKKEGSEYVPTNKEKKKLFSIFKHKLNSIDQHKDLLTTRNIVRTKKELEAWKKNPKSGDVRGIDTQPDSLYDERMAFTRQFVGNPEVIMKAYNWSSKAGFFVPGGKVGRRFISNNTLPGMIYIDTKGPHKKSTYAHEMGHAFDRNIVGSPNKENRRGFIGILPSTTRIFGRTSSGFMIPRDNSDRSEMMVQQIQKVTSKYFNPISSIGLMNPGYMRYRNKPEELFANWFSGFITDRPKAKKKSKIMYNQFRAEFRDYFKGIKAIDRDVTARYLKNMKL